MPALVLAPTPHLPQELARRCRRPIEQSHRIKGFLDEHAIEELTPQQIDGNQVNLRTLLAQANGDAHLATRCRQHIARLKAHKIKPEILADPSGDAAAAYLDCQYLAEADPDRVLTLYLALETADRKTVNGAIHDQFETWLRTNTDLLPEPQPEPA